MTVFLLIFSLLAPQSTSAAQFDNQARHALRLFQDGKPKEALSVLDAAESLTKGLPEKVAKLQFYRGRCLLDLNQPVEALTAFEIYTAKATTDTDRAQGRLWIAKTNRRFFGIVRFQCTTPDIHITHQGKAKVSTEACPAQWEQLVPGLHTFQVKGGKHAGERRIEVVAGKKITIDLDTGKQVTVKLEAPIKSEVRFGVHVRSGVSWATGTADVTVEGAGAMGIEAGVSAEMVWDFGHIGVGPRMELEYRGWSYDLKSTDGQIRETMFTHGLSSPLLLLMTLPAQLELEAGLGTEWVINKSGGLKDDLLFSGVVGAGWHPPFDGWQGHVTVRYMYDFQDLAPTKLRRQSLLVGLGAQFGL